MPMMFNLLGVVNIPLLRSLAHSASNIDHINLEMTGKNTKYLIICSFKKKKGGVCRDLPRVCTLSGKV